MSICAPYIPQTIPARVGVKATRTTNQSIPNITVTAVTWPTEVTDTDAYFTPGSSVITIPPGKAGLYAISATLSYSSSALGANLIRVVAGGVTYEWTAAIVDGVQSAGIVIPLAVADTIVVSAYHTNGGAVNITGGRVEAYLIGL